MGIPIPNFQNMEVIMTLIEFICERLNELSWLHFGILILKAEPITLLLGIILFLAMGWCIRQIKHQKNM